MGNDGFRSDWGVWLGSTQNGKRDRVDIELGFEAIVEALKRIDFEGLLFWKEQWLGSKQILFCGFAAAPCGKASPFRRAR